MHQLHKTSEVIRQIVMRENVLSYGCVEIIPEDGDVGNLGLRHDFDEGDKLLEVERPDVVFVLSH